MIRILQADVVDQIAAGEVLERPANLVKELVENSLDAGADEIEIEFNQGGREVAITDNGKGMSATDLPLALHRHATSKIQASDDLYSLRTFGFRGEALASLAAVSRLTIVSRQSGQAQSWRLDSDFGQVGQTVEATGPQGTLIRVRELFENVPARLRFMKSDSAESTQIKNTLKALALSREDVGFRVRHRGELLFQWPKGQSLHERALSVLGVSALYQGDAQDGESRVEVLLTSPQETFQANRNLWLFAQGRWIQDRSIQAAVMDGYRHLLMHGEYPCAVVRVFVRPEEIDVNVHPAKSQVKFVDSQKIFRLVRRAVRDVLERAPWLGEKASSLPNTLVDSSSEILFSEASGVPTENLSFRAPEFSQTRYNSKVFPIAEVREAVRTYQVQSNPTTSERTTAEGTSAFSWSEIQVVGQLHQTYIVAQSADCFYLVDQHAAHERVVFERLMAGYRSGGLEVQTLLLPLVFDLEESEIESLLSRQDVLSKMGFLVERMGPATIGFTTHPALISESAIHQAIRRLAHDLTNTGDDSALEKVLGDIYASMACHSVVRAGQTLSPEQMHGLLKQMDDFPLSSFCPHGRPVFIRRRFSEIEREFGRIT